ncbi:tRNA (adenosine(37)-N6)-threonylcarbamoyltransferase complex ATPase subunit type 1 TsaE [Treponema sp.]|uniref:tRNA (adenosine(37)-N6)-threonylcarbamoyltransferase complex ATPase subunit type 1 TsaE n=1 Tax=Treponema sp. TaxID=166 RepID=UPI001D91D44F|nr:tRNA (adenosine(37)-N6)-threonylcarbamoyltransferase complex ATPase subunit type 1 TsaE [Treponema sp.]MBS7241777.1 tRNA (adenosine(37)-N6)-threonylcarbamoyltransferase complex ATPase subunit type 1 TsaE [Treponema sp.]MCI6441676.1 tRNA (adenosine(37)-N6)-threonylcarbamoyltransferase complex ATPase subunit type 1 TsaE [Spirochaetia bacterium]MDY4132991.1 tRNA (adenosine(37)-N6)-threonylcarbamoyltransferase complex ATPase subunit type 1 TsaE [Treponema sp.]
MDFLFHTSTSEETIDLGRKIGSLLKAGDVIAMTGTLAAGKTTITKGIAESLGVSDNITSPTFCLISEYDGSKMPLYHMDVYRLEGAEDFVNLGVEDMLYGNGVCIIEWSEKVQSELPKKTIFMKITPSEDGTRTIEIKNWNNGNIEA